MLVWTGRPANQCDKYGRHGMPTLPVCGEPVVGGVCKSDHGIGADLPVEADRDIVGQSFRTEDPAWAEGRA